MIEQSSTEEELEECCGSGCNRCVLDLRQEKQLRTSAAPGLVQRQNVISSNYTPFRVVAVEKFANSILQLTLAHESEEAVDLTNCHLDIPPGHHLMLRAEKPANTPARRERYDKTTENRFMSRPYTPVFVHSDQLQFVILVHAIAGGVMSDYIAELRPGSITHWKGPFGAFNWPRNSYKYLVAIGQGVGVAPLFRICQAIVGDDQDETRIHFLTCHKSLDANVLRRKMHALQSFWNFKLTTFISHPECESSSCRLYGETIHEGRLTQEALREFATRDGTLFAICGRTTFEEEIAAHLSAMKVPAHCIFQFGK